MRDTFFSHVPWLKFWKQNLLDGDIPFWDPYSGLGRPFAADSQTAVFYPLHVLFLLFRVSFALKICLALHLFIAGASMYGLGRHWKLDIFPSLLCAISFMFSTWIIASMEFLTKFTTIAWTPLTLLVMTRWQCRWQSHTTHLPWPGRFWDNFHLTALLGILFAVQYLAGYVPMFLWSLILVLFFVFATGVFRRDSPLFFGSFFAFALAGFIAFLLITPQFLLNWELIHYSERASAMDPGLSSASLHPRHLLTLLMPYLYGRPGYSGQFWGKTLFEFWLGSCYVGILPILFMPLSTLYFFRHHGRGEKDDRHFLVLFWIMIGIFGFLLASGQYTPIYQFLYDHVPGFNRFRWPPYFLVWVLVSLSMLSALGYQALLDDTNQASRRMSIAILLPWTCLLLALVLGALFSSTDPLTHGLTGEAFHRASMRLAQVKNDEFLALFFIVLCLIALIPYFFYPRLRSFHRWSHLVILAICFSNLFVISRQIHFIAQDGIYDREPELLKAIKPIASTDRVHSYGGDMGLWTYGSRDPSVFEWAIAAGVGSTWVPFHVFQTWEGGMKQQLFKAIYNSLPNRSSFEANRLLDLMNVRYLVHGDDMQQEILRGQGSKKVRLEERSSCLPRAYLVRRWTPISEPRETFQKLLSTSFDPREEAIIDPASSEQPPIPPNSQLEHKNSDAGKPTGIQSIQYRANQVRIDFLARDRSLLVLTDAWYPGWKAFMDGADRPIWRVNLLFRGILVNPGAHSVLFVYDPWQFRLGEWISLATALSLGFLLLQHFRRRKSIGC